MLILSLLDSQKSKTLQRWQFEKEPLVNIGRANDNHVVINDDLISRRHVELHQIAPLQWQLISKGTNGSFCKGQQIDKLMLSSGIEVQLAKGGPWLKFELLSTSKTQQIPSYESNSNDLETILIGLNAQFSKTCLRERQEETNRHIGQIQKLQTQIKEEITWLKKQSECPENLLKVLLDTNKYLEDKKQNLKELLTRIEEVKELLEQFQIHLECDQNVAKQLPNQETRVEQLIETIKEQLEELDQELGRIHSEHLLESAKRIFSL